MFFFLNSRAVIQMTSKIFPRHEHPRYRSKHFWLRAETISRWYSSNGKELITSYPPPPPMYSLLKRPKNEDNEIVRFAKQCIITIIITVFFFA